MLLAALLLLAPPSLRYAPAGADGATGRFEATGLTAAQLAAPALLPSFRVTTGPGPALLGTTGVDGGVAWFKPRFPLTLDLPHAASLSVPGGEALALSLTLPRPDATPARLVGVSPEAGPVPENLLKFYLTFSGPMRRGEAYRRVAILDADGVPVESPFLELDEELWSPDGKRLTLFIDPGRIKRGLRPREESGPVFEAGKRYKLRVSAGWPDSAGRLLADSAERAYEATAPLAEVIDPAGWEVVTPRARLGALEVRLGRPLDRALLEHAIAVVGPDGKRLPGAVDLPPGGAAWRFTPARQPWNPGEYKLVIDPRLEDLAGNRVGRLFDTPGELPPGAEEKPAERPFRVTLPAR